jgi:hypothetical protein
MTPGDEKRDNEPRERERYESPRVVRYGNLAQTVFGSPAGNKADGNQIPGAPGKT